jgi:MSHA biogenesis protein MshI
MIRFLKKARKSDARVGVLHTASDSGYAVVSRQADESVHVQADVCPADGEASPVRPARISANLPASCVLDPSDYRLQLIELPSVPAEEMREALRWQAKDMVDYSPADAIVDYIAIPPHVNAGGKRIGYVLVAHKRTVSERQEQADATGLETDVITVPEIALSNIAQLLPQEKYGVALLHFTADKGMLLISREGVVHLIRRLNTGIQRMQDAFSDDFSTQEMAAGLALEIQRSLDYYESHYDCKPITDIVMTPVEGVGPLPDLLAGNLGLGVSRLDLNDIVASEEPLDAAKQAACVLAIGAALGQTDADDPEGDFKQAVNLIPPRIADDVPRFSAAFLGQTAAAGIIVMVLLGMFASSRVNALKAEIEFSRKQEELAVRHLAEASETIRHAVGAEDWDDRRESLSTMLREKQAMLTLLKGQKLGETNGFSSHLQALSASDDDGIWLTRILLHADARRTRLEGYVNEPEQVPAYIRSLTAEGPFEDQGFQVFRIDRPEDASHPLAFAMAGATDQDPATGQSR